MPYGTSDAYIIPCFIPVTNSSVILEIREKLYLDLEQLKNNLSQEALDGLLEELQNTLSFENPAFTAALRYGSRKRFIKAPKQLCYMFIRKPKTNPSIEMPIGFLETLINILRDHQINFQIKNLLTIEKTENLLQSSIQLRDYQNHAVQDMLGRHRGVLVAPCGAGKTVMALSLIYHRQQKTLILVHTLDLLKQWSNQIQNFLGQTCGVIGGGKKDYIHDITVATVQTLIRDRTLLLKLQKKIGCLVVDECHHVPATTFTKLVGKLRPNYLYGFSATPNREDGLSPVMHLFLGPTLHQIKPEDLQAKEQLIRPNLKIIKTDFEFEYNHEEPDSYQQLMEALINDSKRNLQIKNALMKHQKSFNLILSQRVNHCYQLHAMLNFAGISSRVITGQTPKEEREIILEEIRQGKNHFLFATQLADEGLDIRRLDKVWLVTPSRNTSRIEQRIGRIMRLFDGKNSACVYDFVDREVKLLEKQFKTRYYKVYKRLLNVPSRLQWED